MASPSMRRLLEQGVRAFAASAKSRQTPPVPPPSPPLRRTSITCTIGPRSEQPVPLAKVLDAGMDIMRLNFSHGQYEEQGARIANLAAIFRARRAAAPPASSYHAGWPFPSHPVAVQDQCCATAIDTKGPEIRTGTHAGGAKFDLVAGSPFVLRSGAAHKATGDAHGVWVDYPLESALQPGDLVYIDDGQICLRVTATAPAHGDAAGGGELRCTVVHGGRLGEKKGINVPGRPVDLPAFTEYDQTVLKWGVAQGIDIVFASFTRCAADVDAMRRFLAACGPGGDRVAIVAKIESTQGLDNFGEILGAADGVMVARGDLAIEIPLEDVPVAQKSLVARCNAAGKPVIVATQMMESMEKKPRPTRAEAADVANAVLDGADSVMTSGETTNGEHPELVVATMARILVRTEAALVSGELSPSASAAHHAPAVAPGNQREQLAAAALLSTPEDGLLILPAMTGAFAALVARHRPSPRTLVPTLDPRVAHRMLLYSALQPLLVTAPGGVPYTTAEVATLIAREGKPAVEAALAALAGSHAVYRGWVPEGSTAVAAVASAVDGRPSIVVLPCTISR